MPPRAARAVSDRRAMPANPFTHLLAALAFVFGALGIAGAQAADDALAVPIGYSENLRYFAFEEFGIQDGSGLAYSTIYIIDLSEDRWVVGTPIVEIAESEEETLSAVRANARTEVQPRLDDLIITVPAHLLASIADGEIGTDGKSLEFALPLSGGTLREGTYRLDIEQFPASSGAPCEDWFGEQALGFLLKLTDFGPTREIHRDAVLPRSRGCPADYRIHSVYAPFQAESVAHMLALISVYAHGYEGYDRRFVGIALAKNQVSF